ncbi:MAG: MATE family efflux transporter, partial [Gammaproteobacteria bacterium]
LASVLFDFLYCGVTFLRMGTTGVVAQDYGARNIAECRQALFEGVLTALAISVLILALHHPLMNLTLDLLNGSHAAREQAEVYFKIKIWGAPAVLITMVIMGWLIGMQQATAVLKLTVLTSLVNGLLDLIFVFGFDMGVRGVAFAALIAAYVAVLWGAILCFRTLKLHRVYGGMKLPDLARLKRFMALNSNILVRTLCLIGAFSLFTRYGAKQGDIVLAANALLLSLQMLLALALDGYANALEVLVGQAIGAKDRAGFTQSIKLGMFWSLVSACLFCAAYALFGNDLLRLLTDIPQVRLAAAEYLPWMVLSPLVAVWCFVFDGVFIGATQGKSMRNSMVFALFIVFLPALLLTEPFGNHGLWAAFMLFFAGRGLSMMWLFYRLDTRGQFVRAVPT